MLIGDGNIAEVATIHGGIIVTCFDGGVVDAVCSHISIYQALKRSVLRGKARFDVVDAADTGQAASRGHRCASKNARSPHICYGGWNAMKRELYSFCLDEYRTASLYRRDMLAMA